MTPDTYRAGDLGFDRGRVSPNALFVVEELRRAGFDGYLVGGCVRDLILGHTPKDFDVTTDASPEQIADLFDRTRIIGRRFRLVHVKFGRGRNSETLEVATYRALPPGDGRRRGGGRPTRSASGRILDDNVFGTIDADAVRRDFTINAFYYDPVNEEVLDFADGMADIRSRTLRIIGDPKQRFAEDPVRMLRVTRFKAKLEMQVARDTADAIADCAHLIGDVPGARLFDEVFKLFHHTAAVATWRELGATALLKRLFGQTAAALSGDGGERFERFIGDALANTDARVRAGRPVIPGYFFAVILWWPFRRALARPEGAKGPAFARHQSAVDRVFRKQSATIAVPYRVVQVVSEIWEFQQLLEKRNPGNVRRIMDHPRFRAAYDFLLLRSRIEDCDPEVARWWTDIQDHAPARRQEMIDALPRPPACGGKKRRRRRKPGHGRADPGRTASRVAG